MVEKLSAQIPERNILVKPVNCLASEWLYFNVSTKHFCPIILSNISDGSARYQWVNIRRDYPFEIAFPASKNLCLFLNNQLIFKADSTDNYILNLTNRNILPKLEGQCLLTVWSPDIPPKLEDFRMHIHDSELNMFAADNLVHIRNLPRKIQNQSAFILFLMLIGVIYGSLRTSFYSVFASVFRIGNIFRSYSQEEGFLAKPLGNWSSILFVFAFSLSFSLLIVGIHTNIQNVFIFRQIFLVSESDIVIRIVFDALLIFVFVLSKYVFLQLMAYIFDVVGVVNTQYREFLRSILFMGMFLPFVMLFYLAFNQINPAMVLLCSTLAVSTVLVLTVLRVGITLNKKSALKKLHLFSYLWATEIIPLAVMLKLIVFNY